MVPESLNAIVTPRSTSVLLLRGISVHTSEEGIASVLNRFAPVLQVCVCVFDFDMVYYSVEIFFQLHVGGANLIILPTFSPSFVRFAYFETAPRVLRGVQH